MPLFEVEDENQVVPFRQRRGGADLYEREIEDMLWQNFEELTGESVFPIAKQAGVAGGRADIIALDHNARVVVVEIKRDVDRGQLAQCLEYAGWARTTNLDELAGMDHRASRLSSGTGRTSWSRRRQFGSDARRAWCWWPGTSTDARARPSNS